MLNSILAWVMKTDLAIKLIEKWSFDYIKMECAGEKCYGVLAVRILRYLSKVQLSLCGMYRSIEFASLWRCSTSFSALFLLVFRIQRTRGLRYKMGEL